MPVVLTASDPRTAAGYRPLLVSSSVRTSLRAGGASSSQQLTAPVPGGVIVRAGRCRVLVPSARCPPCRSHLLRGHTPGGLHDTPGGRRVISPILRGCDGEQGPVALRTGQRPRHHLEHRSDGPVARAAQPSEARALAVTVIGTPPARSSTTRGSIAGVATALSTTWAVLPSGVPVSAETVRPSKRPAAPTAPR